MTQLEKTVDEGKSTIDGLKKENTNLTEQIEKNTLEKKINKVVAELQKHHYKVNYEMNKSLDESRMFISSIVEYDSSKNAIVIKKNTKSLDYEDEFTIKLLYANKDVLGKFISTSESDYDYAKLILDQQSIDSVEVIIEEYMGENRAFTYTKNINGDKIDF